MLNLLAQTSLSSTQMMEVTFNIVYLGFIWVIDFLMLNNRKNLHPEAKRTGLLILYGFILLALGDTGHVGFRVVALFSGGLEANSKLVGLGALSTAITVGILYMLILEMWRTHFNKSKDNIYWILMGVGVIRLVLFIFPQNKWGNVVPPFDWSLIRNIPLMIQGLGVALLITKEARAANDKTFLKFGNCIYWSYAFYTPVILFVQMWPMVGMLMIPKTLAYMAMAWIGYNAYFKEK